MPTIKKAVPQGKKSSKIVENLDAYEPGMSKTKKPAKAISSKMKKVK